MEDDLSPPKKIPIRIQLWDRDDIDPDDRIDIDHSEDSKSISVLLSFQTGVDAIGMRAGVLYLSDDHTEVPGSELLRTENISGGLTPAWITDTIYSKGCDGDRAEISYNVEVTKEIFW